MTRVLGIVSEPRGETYEGLLRLGLRFCSAFSLVWEQERSTSEEVAVAEALRGNFIREEQTNEWPGTIRLVGSVLLRRYRYDEKALSVLQQVPGLYSWLHPFPEDLALYDKWS